MIVNFWASWCPPCQAETPILRDVYNEHADEGLALVAISVQETTAADVAAWFHEAGLKAQKPKSPWMMYGFALHVGRKRA